MAELDLFRNFRRGVAAPSADAHRRASARLARALDEASGGQHGTRARPRWSPPTRRARCCGARRRRGRRPQPSAPCVTSLATGSRTLNVTSLPVKARGGALAVRILSNRTAQAADVGGGSCLSRTQLHRGSHGPVCASHRARAGSPNRWPRAGVDARLVGFVTRPGEAKQRVVITMKGRPQGVFVLTPLQPGVLKRDSGTLIYTYATG